MLGVFVLALAVGFQPCCGHVRTVLDLNRDWAFKLSYRTTGGNCSSDELPLNISQRLCPGLREQGRPEDGGPASAAACRNVCCGDDGCNAWQWCPQGSFCSPAESCWTGFSVAAGNGSCPLSSGWLGGARQHLPTPEQPFSHCVLPECQVNVSEAGWELLSVPHDFIVTAEPSKHADKSHGFLPFGAAWYRRFFAMPRDAQQKSVWIEFDGVMVNCKVWLNGVFLGFHRGGYTPFRFELGFASTAQRYMRWTGENVLAIQVDATKPDSWWYDGGGIYRNVRLVVASPLHISQWGVYAPASIEGAINVENLNANARVQPSVEFESHFPVAVDGWVTAVVQTANGHTLLPAVRYPFSILPHSTQALELPNISIPNATLWSLSRPTLYTMRVTVEASLNGDVADEQIVSFGVRSVTWSADSGFFLNGIPTKILGVANHQDYPPLGVAVPDSLQDYRVLKMKQFGANAWRTAHNPPNEALLDAADRLGMLVWDENHRNGKDEEMAILVRRDRNHPCIIIWSVCNEALCHTDDMASDALRLQKLTKHLDPHMGRLVSANENAFNGNAAVLELQGFDYSLEDFDRWHCEAPHVPSIASESSSAVSDRGEYQNSSASGHVSGFDTNFPDWGASAESAWQHIFDRSYVAGGFTWTGWDYRGEPTPYAWPDVNSHFGIVDAAGFFKDRSFWYQAWWLEPRPAVLHVFPHWTWRQNNCLGPCHFINGSFFVDLWVYSNAHEVELFLSGNVSLGRRLMPQRGHLEWRQVLYVPGTLTAVAYVDGNKDAEKQIHTAGSPLLLQLAFQDGVGAAGIDVDRTDLALIVASVVDSAGRVVPDSDAQVSFSARGAEVIGTANGDPACLTASNASSRTAFHGLVLAVVRALDAAGVATVKASSPGLLDATLQLRVHPSRTEVLPVVPYLNLLV